MISSLGVFAPQNFSEYIGQVKAKTIASVIVSAAQTDHRPVPSIIIDGSYGLGKTSLARVIRFESGERHPQIVDAAAVNKSIPTLTRPIIIDEIHNLDPEVSDSMNIMMDRGTAAIIGCTTNPGALSSAFRSRFRAIHLDPYTDLDIAKILWQAIHKQDKVTFPTIVVADTAKRSRLNPRVALNNLAFMLDFATVNNSMVMSVDLSRRAFEILGIDDNGFTDRDYAYMRALPDDRPVGIQYLASVTGIDQQTIQVEIEPYLMQTGKIDRMPRGRIKLREL